MFQSLSKPQKLTSISKLIANPQARNIYPSNLSPQNMATSKHMFVAESPLFNTQI